MVGAVHSPSSSSSQSSGCRQNQGAQSCMIDQFYCIRFASFKINWQSSVKSFKTLPFWHQDQQFPWECHHTPSTTIKEMSLVLPKKIKMINKVSQCGDPQCQKPFQHYHWKRSQLFSTQANPIKTMGWVRMGFSYAQKIQEIGKDVNR